MLLEIVTNKKVTNWKKFHVIYHLFLVCKIVMHIVTFTFYCIITPTTIFVPDIHIPKWGCVYIPTIITLLNYVGTPRSFTCFSSGSSLKMSCHCIEPRPH